MECCREGWDLPTRSDGIALAAMLQSAPDVAKCTCATSAPKRLDRRITRRQWTEITSRQSSRVSFILDAKNLAPREGLDKGHTLSKVE